MLTQYAFDHRVGLRFRHFAAIAAPWKGPAGLWWGAILTITLGEGVSRRAAERYRLQPVGRDCDLHDGDDIYRH